MPSTATPTRRKQKKKNQKANDENERIVKELVARYRRGDKRAFNEIVRRYKNQVAALAYKVVNDYDEAADVMQNVFVKMSKSLWRYDERKKFYTWLYRITVNASIDHLRKQKRHRHDALEDYGNRLESSGKKSPEFHYSRTKIREHIEDAAETLNRKQRDAFFLRDIEGCKVDDVADIMDMPEATVRWYLHRARARIRKELHKRCPHLLVSMGISKSA